MAKVIDFDLTVTDGTPQESILQLEHRGKNKERLTKDFIRDVILDKISCEAQTLRNAIQGYMTEDPDTMSLMWLFAERADMIAKLAEGALGERLEKLLRDSLTAIYGKKSNRKPKTKKVK